jgi:hypothetical protein
MNDEQQADEVPSRHQWHIVRRSGERVRVDISGKTLIFWEDDAQRTSRK